ncbi:hypothetical protein [Chelatococcus reniformis]|nr:hypothetical protein [Chelatococcus reniformis]
MDLDSPRWPMHIVEYLESFKVQDGAGFTVAYFHFDPAPQAGICPLNRFGRDRARRFVEMLVEASRH